MMIIITMKVMIILISIMTIIRIMINNDSNELIITVKMMVTATTIKNSNAIFYTLLVSITIIFIVSFGN